MEDVWFSEEKTLEQVGVKNKVFLFIMSFIFNTLLKSREIQCRLKCAKKFDKGKRMRVYFPFTSRKLEYTISNETTFATCIESILKKIAGKIFSYDGASHFLLYIFHFPPKVSKEVWRAESNKPKKGTKKEAISSDRIELGAFLSSELPVHSVNFDEQRCTFLLVTREEFEQQNMATWIHVIQGFSLGYITRETSDPKFQKMLHKGVPAFLRGTLWSVATGAHEVASTNQGMYCDFLFVSQNEQLEQVKESSTELSILEKDISRTFPEHQLFRESSGRG